MSMGDVCVTFKGDTYIHTSTLTTRYGRPVVVSSILCACLSVFVCMSVSVCVRVMFVRVCVTFLFVPAVSHVRLHVAVVPPFPYLSVCLFARPVCVCIFIM